MNLNFDWSHFLEDELSQAYVQELQKYISKEYKIHTVYPAYENIFKAFNLVPLEKLKVVIVGQDPYHGANQANGLAFSVNEHVKIPPSLRNIYKELVEDIGCASPHHGNLAAWAKEGVLLINSVLSVRHGEPNSHKNKGWEDFTDTVIRKISQDFRNVVFILWGAPAQKKMTLIDAKKHLILTSAHPSPLSAYRGFFGSRPFSKTNAYLVKNDLEPINWCLSAQQTLL